MNIKIERKKEIDKKREELNRILGNNNVSLLDSDILKLSQNIDELIVDYYKGNNTIDKSIDEIIEEIKTV